MKKLALIVAFLAVFATIALTILHFVGVFSVYEIVKGRIMETEVIKTYMLNEEDKAAWQAETENLRNQLVLAREEKEDLTEQLLLLNKMLAGKDETIESLKGEIVSIRQEKMERQKGLQQMANIYKEMAPADAALVLGSLDEELILQMFSYWEDRFAAKVLASLELSLSRRLTELMAN